MAVLRDLRNPPRVAGTFPIGLTAGQADCRSDVRSIVADRYIHSGVLRVDPRGLTTDNFVPQGGDRWGFDNGDDFERGQALQAEPIAQPAIGDARLDGRFP